jgi:hypothetical protein
MGEDFYDLTSPSYIQQGDIFPNVPIIELPPGRNLVVLRESNTARWQPRPGPVQAFDERSINSFDEGVEFIAVTAQRSLAVVLTQTCDLEQEQWLVCPLTALEGLAIDEGNLFAGKYANLFGMPKHPNGYFGNSYLFLSQPYTIRRETVGMEDRVASMSLSAQHALSDKLSQTLTRVWGFSPGELVHQAGSYRCIRCFQFFGLSNVIVDFNAGEKFTECQDCVKIRKSAQWHLLRKHAKY